MDEDRVRPAGQRRLEDRGPTAATSRTSCSRRAIVLYKSYLKSDPQGVFAVRARVELWKRCKIELFGEGAPKR